MIATKPTTFICTLDGQPQMVTSVLDACLADGVPMLKCIVLHFANNNSRIKQSLNKLNREFANGRYPERPFSFQLCPIQNVQEKYK